MTQISVHRLLGALSHALTHPITLLALCGLAIYATYVIFATSTRSTSIDVTIRTFYQLMKRESWGQVWSHLSPELRFSLSDEAREVLKVRGPVGSEQLKHLATRYEGLFKHSNPQIISKHRVPGAPEGAEMIMVHTRNRPSGHGVTLWLVRHVHSQGYWMIEEVLVHPTKHTKPYMLTGKRFVAPKSPNPPSEDIQAEHKGERDEVNAHEETTSEPPAEVKIKPQKLEPALKESTLQTLAS